MTPPRSFGVFAPVGYLVLAFQDSRRPAEILTGDFQMSDEVRLKARELLEMTRKPRTLPTRFTDPSAN